jgi:pyrimidine-nucleoside phosphorylase
MNHIINKSAYGGVLMRMYDLIIKKRNRNSLTTNEINFIIQGYTDGTIPDYQVSALLMAIYFNGMDSKETLSLTMAMKNSGDCLDLSNIKGINVKNQTLRQIRLEKFRIEKFQ